MYNLRLNFMWWPVNLGLFWITDFDYSVDDGNIQYILQESDFKWQKSNILINKP